MTGNSFLEKSYWGFRKGPQGLVYRTPLPEVGPFRSFDRGLAKTGSSLVVPPYLTAEKDDRGNVHVMLCDGEGWRASYDEERANEEQWVYADGDNLPHEWTEPVGAALSAIKKRWPGAALVMRPNRDKLPTHPYMN